MGKIVIEDQDGNKDLIDRLAALRQDLQERSKEILGTSEVEMFKEGLWSGFLNALDPGSPHCSSTIYSAERWHKIAVDYLNSWAENNMDAKTVKTMTAIELAREGLALIRSVECDFTDTSSSKLERHREDNYATLCRKLVEVAELCNTPSQLGGDTNEIAKTKWAIMEILNGE